jgi:excisionase family DNA binding protein
MLSHTSRPPKLSAPVALSIKEACDLSSIGRTKLYELIKDNKIPARKLGRRTIILTTDLEEWLKSLPPIGRAS